MYNGGQVADQMVGQALKVNEQLLKFTGWGAKELGALLMLLMKSGYSKVAQMFVNEFANSNIPPEIISIKKDDLERFKQECKQFKVKSWTITDPEANYADVVLKSTDAPFVNKILEKMGYAPQYIYGEDMPKNENAPLPLENELSELANSLNPSTKMTSFDKTGGDLRPSIVEKVEGIKMSLNIKAKDKEDLER